MTRNKAIRAYCTSHADEIGLSVALFIQPLIVKVRIECYTFVVDIRRPVVIRRRAVPVVVFHFRTCSLTNSSHTRVATCIPLTPVTNRHIHARGDLTRCL